MLGSCKNTTRSDCNASLFFAQLPSGCIGAPKISKPVWFAQRALCFLRAATHTTKALSYILGRAGSAPAPIAPARRLASN